MMNLPLATSNYTSYQPGRQTIVYPNNPSYQYSSIRNVRKSRIEDHNIYQATDKLYDPLRNVLLHP